MSIQVPWYFNHEQAALIVIDMQNDFVNEGAIMEVPMARKFLPNMKKIIEQCRLTDIPVIYTRHVLYEDMDISPLEVSYNVKLREAGLREGTSGVQIVKELNPESNEIIITKHRYDAFYNTPLEIVLQNIHSTNRIDTLIIIGTVTNICCESTARSAFMRDYKVVFISDANGGLDQASHDATLSIIEKVFGRVMDTEELLSYFTVKNI